MGVDLSSIMVHKPPMLLADHIVEAGDGFGVTSFKIEEENIFLDEDGVFAREALIECAAQSIAASNAYAAFLENRATDNGFLVGLKDFVVYQDARLGDVLTCQMRVTDRIAQTHIVSCSVSVGDVLLAEGEIRIFVLAE
ncbi:hypothetical protein FACS189487_03690 [Campylobacterota bacterium]|nr:hypothetical protein FACS189487_03690 [Campylobacterota bacterium]